MHEIDGLVVYGKQHKKRSYFSIFFKTIASFFSTFHQLGIYKQHRNFLLVLLKKWTQSFDFLNFEIELKIFKICQALLAEKDYYAVHFFYNLVPPDYRPLIGYVVTLQKEMPKELGKNYESEESIKDNIEQFTTNFKSFSLPEICLIKTLDNLFKYVSNFSSVPFYMAALIQTLIQRIKAVKLLDYFLNFNLTSLTKTQEIIVRYFLSYLNNSDLRELEDKIKLLQLNEQFKTIFSGTKIFDLLKDLTNEEQIQLLSYYHSNTDVFDTKGILIKFLTNCNGLTKLCSSKMPFNMPIGLYGMVSASAAFENFLVCFEKANKFSINKFGPMYLIDYENFLFVNLFKILTLYEIMGDDLFLFMKKKIKSSPTTLVRYFENIKLIPTDYFAAIQCICEKFRLEIVLKENSIFNILLLQIGSLEELYEEILQKKLPVKYTRKTLSEAFMLICQDAKSLRKVSCFLADCTAELYAVLLHCCKNSSLDFSKLKNNLRLFSRLLIARRAMKSKKLDVLFDTIISYDLTKEGQFNDLWVAEHTVGSLEERLVSYNKNIQHLLCQNGIITTEAFSYTKNKKFSIESNSTLISSLAEKIFDDLENLEGILRKHIERQSIEFFSNGYVSNLTNILTKILKIKTQVNQDKSGEKIPIQNGVLDKQLEYIGCKLENLLKIEKFKGLQVVGNNFEDHKAALFIAREKHVVRPRGTRYKEDFRIQQWDKNKLETFILGDYVNCCLAPDGGNFPAMMLRRLDAATVIHAVYDEALNEPVCMSGLFFVHDKRKRENIYVVANFFDIRTGYALDEVLRKRLVDELLAFIWQYTKDIGAKELLLNPLRYGLIPDFTDYNKIKMKVKKVGGFFSPAQEDNDQFEEWYHLTAVDEHKFYVYQEAPIQEAQSLLRY